MLGTAMIIDREGNQILDESAIPMAAFVLELEKYMERASLAALEVEELRKQISKLNEELADKQSIIDRFQVEDYFRVNYPNGHPNDRQ